MMRRSGLIGLVVVVFLFPSATSAAGPITGALPAGARLVTSERLPGYQDTYAVVYRSGHSYLGLVELKSGRGHVVWSRHVSTGAASLSAPGPKGMFRALVTGPGAVPVHLYAYRFHDGSISSAIGGHLSGSISGDDGIVLSRTGFKVRVHDSAHVGSVAYRLVTTYRLSSSLYTSVGTIRVPDYPAGHYPVPNATVRTTQRDLILLKLEVAATEQARETGLMNRHSLDPDSGMLFVWSAPAHEAFWMENTYIPLTVAFLDAGGRIQEMQDMAPLTTTLHMPAQPYMYAVEVNQGFFAANGIQVGDVLQIHLQ